MNAIVRNILAPITGIIVGSVVNMGIITISGSIIPPPEGADVTTTEGLKASMHLFQVKHFVFPFLAHALGTFAGALLAAVIAANRKLIFALVVGVFFMLGGIASIFMIPSPIWFMIVDLLIAYLPMAYLGAKLVNTKSNELSD